MRTHWLIGKSRSSSDATQEDQVMQVPQHSVFRSQSNEGRVAKVRPYAFNSSTQLTDIASKLDRPETLTFLSPQERPAHRVISRASSLVEYRSLHNTQKQTYSSSSDHSRVNSSSRVPRNGFERAILTSVFQDESSDNDDNDEQRPRLLTSNNDITDFVKENNNRIPTKLIKVDKHRNHKKRTNQKYEPLKPIQYKTNSIHSSYCLTVDNSSHHLDKLTQTSPETTVILNTNNFVWFLLTIIPKWSFISCLIWKTYSFSMTIAQTQN